MYPWENPLSSVCQLFKVSEDLHTALPVVTQRIKALCPVIGGGFLYRAS